MKHKVAAIFPSFERYAVVNERKWFSMDMMMAITVFIILSLYLYHTFSTTGFVLIGTFTMVWQYIEKMRQAFESFTWQRNGIMEASTNLHTIDSIETAYSNLKSKSNQIVFDTKHPFHIQKLSFSYTNN
jgi:ABC-type multidrug transport system fused ATPase/permease subunit